MSAAATSPATASRIRRSAFRPDIEGMRAVAILLVLVYHAGVRQLPGGFIGVDVFFVISGFLITGLLLREIVRTGRISLPSFYAKRAKRLLPATGVVLVATTFLTWLTTSVVEWRTFGLDIVSTALYVINWRLADRSVDYLAEDVGVSPVQHFWSLAIEEQFYIVWPVLLVALAWWWRRSGRRGLRPLLAVGITAMIIPSFIYSIHLTGADPATAFFVTPGRLWELGLGALLSIGTAVWRQIPRKVAAAIGWLGLGVIAASGVLITSSTPWPGYASLAPTLGTSAMIVAGFASGRLGPAIVLGCRPAVWIGGLSYSMYLWHWPFIIAATAYWGDLGARRGLLVIALSTVPAYLTNRLIENPIRFSNSLAESNRLTLSIGANFTAIGAVAGLALILVVPATSSPDDSAAASGATALTSPSSPGATPADGSIESLTDIDWMTPDPTLAVEDVPEIYDDGCQVSLDSATPIPCEWGDPEGEITVAVIGDSKMAQWYSAVDAVAREEGWRVLSHTKSSCGFTDGVQLKEGGPYESCVAWNAAVLDDLIASEPDVILTSQRINMALADPTDTDSASKEAMTDALVRQWEVLSDAGLPVIALLDNPNPGMTVYECVAENMDDLQACTFERQAGIESSGAAAQLPALERSPAVATLDMTPAICPDEECLPIIGNVLVYRQGTHVTDTYVRTATDALSENLVPLVQDATS